MEKKTLFTSDPLKMEFLRNLAENSSAGYNLHNIFCIFHTNNILYLLYFTEDRSIVTYDLTNRSVVNEKKNAHEKNVTSLDHVKVDGKDIIMSVSCEDNNVKLWDFNNWECILDLKNVNPNGVLRGSCFLKDNDKYYIVTSNSRIQYLYEGFTPEPIKIYDLQGNKVKEIAGSNDDTLFVDVYYADKKKYIVACNDKNLKAYDYEEGKLFKTFIETDLSNYMAIIHREGEVTKLIGSNYDGKVRIWNFNSGELLNTFNVHEDYIYGICLWDNKHLFVGCGKKIKLVDLSNGNALKTLEGQESLVLAMEKVVVPDYGDCLISEGVEKIKLWKLNA